MSKKNGKYLKPGGVGNPFYIYTIGRLGTTGDSYIFYVFIIYSYTSKCKWMLVKALIYVNLNT